jgi:hypothetical protein
MSRTFILVLLEFRPERLIVEDKIGIGPLQQSCMTKTWESISASSAVNTLTMHPQPLSCRCWKYRTIFPSVLLCHVPKFCR